MSKITTQLKKYFGRLEETLGKSFYHDPVMIAMMSVYGLLMVFLLFLLMFQVQPSASQVPLSYNILYGVTYSSAWYGIYAYLGALLIIGILNFLLSWAFFDKERLISYLISCVTLFIAVLTILYTYNLTVLVK